MSELRNRTKPVDLNGTTRFVRFSDGQEEPSLILSHVYGALEAKGYDPVTQLVGFILTGDPTYITSYNNARSMICRLERDEILEELVRYYIHGHFPAR